MFTLRFKETALIGLRFARLALLPISLLIALSSCNITFFTTPAPSSSSSTTTTPAVVATPQISPASGSYTSAQTVSITDATAGATIYYTTDGTTPTTSSTLYTGSFAVSSSGTTTVEAIAAESGMTTSSVDSVSYSISPSTVGVPAFSVAGGFYYADQSVTITDPTSGAKIFYTTDGTTPTTSSSIYNGTPITVSGAGTTETITAYATESGLNDSGTTSATYTMSLFTAAQQQFQTSTVPYVAAGDLNGDGKADIVGVESNGYLQIYLQSGGVLQTPVLDSQVPSGASTAPTSIAVGDLNGDGLNDIAVGYGNSSLIAVYLQSSNNTFGAPTTISTADSSVVRIGDVTGDGLADLVGLAWSSSTTTNDLSVFAQQSGGTLGAATTYAVQEGGYPQMAIADVSGDGLNDVVVMSGQTYGIPQLSVLTQASTGGTLNTPQTYSLPVSSTNANGMGVGDVNGDGLNDVILSFGDTSPAPQLAVYLQNSSGTLTAATSTVAVQQRPTSLAVLDVNGDGLNDIVADNGYNYGLDVYLQQSNGSYTHEASYLGGQNFGNLVTGDFNGDGKIDLAGSITIGTNQGIVLFTHR